MNRLLSLALCSLLALVVAGCGGDGSETTTAATETTSTETTESTGTAGTTTPDGASAVGCVEVEAPPTGSRKTTKPKPLDASKTYAVTMKTNCGSFTIGLDTAQSPKAAESFVSLAEQGYFDRTVFHRIVPDFVIQGGDPTASGTGGPGYSTVDTPPDDARYSHGVVAMAKTGAEPAVTMKNWLPAVPAGDAGLPPDYAIIGKVTEGLDVVDAIGQFGDPTDPAGTATKTVEIEKATVSTS
jgi:cyclophilin family peptidyl-prolyl cis-trans isomerase